MVVDLWLFNIENIESLLAQVVALLDSWKAVWNEAKLAASSMQLEVRLFSDRSTIVKVVKTGR